METQPSSEELKIKLLWDLANALPPENHTNQLLRSYYLTACKKIDRWNVKLPAENFASSVMCSKCSSIWSQSKFSLKLKPRRIKSKKAQKLVETLHNDSKSLTKKQRIRSKWLKKRIFANVEIKCEFCQKKTLQRLIKQKKPKEEEPEVVVEVPLKKKKKKKAKDKSAGLKLEKVKPQTKTTPEQTKPNPQTTKPKKAKKPKVQPLKGKVVKVISNTQKQNSLLQLANMLKNRSSTVPSKSNNQLEKLLR